MTQTTEQERAEYVDGAWYWVEFQGLGSTKHVAPAMYKADSDAWYSYEWSGHTTRFVKVLEPCVMQAARRAPVVPEGWTTMFGNPLEHFFRGGESLCEVYSISPEIDLSEAPRIGKYACPVCKKALAAAPQPPEGLMSEILTSKTAAPVQLPEPVAYWRTGATDVLHNFRYDAVKSPHWQSLYTEHQVRQLLAAQEQSK